VRRPPVRATLALAAVAVTAGVVVAVPTLRSSDPVDPPAALPDGAVDVRRDPSGTVRSLATEPGEPIHLSSTEPAAAADEFVDRYGQVLGPGELVTTSATPRLDGGVALRFRQEVDGIPVVGGEASVQVAPDGGVLSSLADLSADAPRLVPPTSTVSGGVARRAAVEATARDTGADPSTLAATAPAQWIYDPAVLGPPSPLGPRLTWRVEVTSADGTVDQLVLIDAERGGAVLSFSQLADGLERRICDAANIRGPQPCSAPYARIEGQPPVPGGGGADEVNLAYTYAGHTYDFFLDHFGRDGIDGAGSAIRIKVRYCSTEPASPCPYANAFWSPAYDQAIFGQGYARADDVVAHELTHGVTEATANLYYWYQSGAISESMSDVFGELVDQTNGTGRDGAGFRWRIGEDLPGGSLRHMATPTASPYLDPDRMTSSLYAADPTGIDAGGVHTNSGVGNRAAALITAGGTLNGQTVQGLGIDKTAAVYYETLTAMLTSASDYADLAVALPQACRNLIGEAAGITETDCTQVDKAVLATEMATQPTTPGAAAPEAPVSRRCRCGDRRRTSRRTSRPPCPRPAGPAGGSTARPTG
jgi:Zn-dependent metalloprotease